MLSQSLTPCMSVCACKMDTGRKTRAGDLSVLNGAIMITHQSSEDARSIVPPSWRGIRAQRGRLDLRSLTPSAPQTAAGCKESIPGKPPARRAHYHQAQEGKKKTHTHTHTHSVCQGCYSGCCCCCCQPHCQRLFIGRLAGYFTA